MNKTVKTALIATAGAIVVHDSINLIRFTQHLKKAFPSITVSMIVKTVPDFWKYCFEIARDTGYVATTPAQIELVYRAFLNENYYYNEYVIN